MPERKTTRRKFLTPDVQGEDSWVMLRSMTVGEVLDLQRGLDELPSIWQRLVGRFRKSKGISRADNYEQFANRVMRHVADWNWVDHHGQPLPNPREHPEVVTQLTDAEMVALTKIVYGEVDAEETKN
jgi:hypothetical protein